jgi:4-hydroxybenzoate polyprenyltransferase
MPPPPFDDANPSVIAARQEPETMAEAPPAIARGRLSRLVDSVAFSNLLPASIAAAISVSASRALEASNAGLWATIAATGTFVVYTLDRLRDTARDRSTSPQRTEYVERNRRPLTIAVVFATVALAAALSQAPPRIALLCGGVGAIGLLHRRLKGWALFKTTYVSLAWVAVSAGMPWLAEDGFGFSWLAGIYFASFAANLIASDLRDEDIQVLLHHRLPALCLARATALVGVAVALLAPMELRPLIWIPAAEALALVFYRPTELYGQFAVDGALLAGATASLLHFLLG